MESQFERAAESFAFVNTFPNGVLILDEDSNILVANLAMETLTGYPIKLLQEMNVKDLIPHGVKNPHDGKLSTVIQNGGGPRQMKALSAVPMKRRTGEVIKVNVERFVYRYQDGRRRFTGIITPASVSLSEGIRT